MRKPSLLLLALALPLASLSASLQPAWALSEIQREDLPAPSTAPAVTPGQPAQPGDESTPAPGAEPSPSAEPVETPAPPADALPGDGEAGPEATGPETTDAPRDPNRPEVSENGPLPDVLYDLATLPEPVRRMHGLLLDACRSGDIEKLRPLIGTGEDATQVSLGDVDGDVIDFLKQSSGDGKGLEILAILEEVLSAGFVHLEAGTPEELYVWPYFFAIPLDRLTGRQQVELFKIVTSGDVEEMKTYGAYIFYRIGITPEGRWAFFLAGD